MARVRRSLEPQDAAAYVKRGSHQLQRKMYAEAAAALARGLELDPTSAAAHANLGLINYRQRKFSEAIAEFTKSIELEPRNAATYGSVLARAHASLGDQKQLAGSLADAADHFRKASLLEPAIKAFAERVELLKSMQALHKRLPGILEEKKKASPVELLRLAEICRAYQNEHAASARLFGRVIETQPASPEISKRFVLYQAACSAALASAGQSKDAENLTEDERAKFRRLASGWLRADLRDITARLESAEGILIWSLEQRLSNWQSNAHLGTLRDAAALAQLPREETKEWQGLWHETDVLLKQVRARINLTVSTGALTAKKKTRLHEQKVRAGYAYIVNLESTQFDTFLKAEEQNGVIIGQNDDVGVDNTNSRLFLSTTLDGTIRILVSAHEDAGIGSYVLTVREFKNVADKSKQPLKGPKEVVRPKEVIHPGEPLIVGDGLTLKGELGKKSTSIIYKVKLTGGKNYVIDMVSPDSKNLDPYLFLLDAAGDKLAEDDDGGDALNARIRYQVVTTGVYQIRATSYQNVGRGPFTLTVREQK